MDKRQRRRGLSIRFKVIFVICFVAFTIICVDTVISYINDYNLLRRIISEDSEEMAKQLSLAVSRIIDEEIKDVKIYVSNFTWTEAIVSENSRLESEQADKRMAYFVEMDRQWQISSEESNLVRKYTENAVAKDLRDIVKKDPDIAEILVADRYGGLVAASGKTTDFYQADEEWHKEFFKPDAENIYISKIKRDKSSDTLSLALAIAITDRSENIIGVCKIILHAKRILAPIADFKFKKTGHAVLVGREGYMVYHADFNIVGKSYLSSVEDWKDIKGKASGTIIFNAPHHHDEKIFVSYAEVDNKSLLNNNIKWTVFIDQDIDEVFSPLFFFAAQELSALAILTIILIVLGVIFGTILVKPIKNIAIGIKHIGNGNLDYKIDVRSSDEFGLLTDTINNMASNLKKSTASIDVLNKEIEAHKKAETALGESHIRYKTLFDSSADAVMLIIPKGKFIAGNEATIKLFSCKDESEFITKTPMELSPEYQPDGKSSDIKSKEMMDIAMEKGTHFFEWTHKRLNGYEFSATVLLTRMRLGDQKLLQATVRDITERKKNEQAILDAAEEWQRTFNSISDIVFIQDTDFTIIRANKAMFAVLKKKPEEVIGRKCYEILHNGDKPWPGCPFGKTKLDKRVHTEEVEDPNIGIPLLVTVSPMFDKKDKLIGSVHIARDITERKKIDKMKDEFISTVSHELRTPLSITKEGISLILDEVPGKINDGQKKILIMGRDNIDRLARIINDLLDISKIESGKAGIRKRIVNISSLIKEICKSWILEFDKENKNLRLHLPKRPMDIHADCDKISEIMNNLISNALKFIPKKGYVDIHVKDAGDSAEVIVADTGIGISKSNISRIFEKFQQFGRKTGPGAKGTGLGLAIAKKLIELHGGKIKVESKLKKGTSFILTIPKE